MRRCRRVIAASALLSALSGGATGTGLAQHGQATREIAGGGLLFVNDPNLLIEQHDVIIDATEISLTYVLQNVGTDERALVVAFPMPELDMAAVGDQAIGLPAPESSNFVAATFTVDGAPIPVEIEQRATAIGLDVMRALEQAKVPLLPHARQTRDRLAELPPALRKDFEQRGIVRLNAGKVEPNWTLRATAFWRQAIKLGKPVTIRVTYRPIVATARYAPALIDNLRASHCIDASVEAAITRKVAASGGATTFRWMSYALTNGSHLIDAIGKFRLQVRTADINTIVATCRKAFRRPGPTTLEWAANDFHPDEDVHLLFID